MLKIFTALTLLQTCTALHSTAEGLYDLPLCYPDRVVQHFRIEDPAEIAACDKFSEPLAEISIGDVYAPTSPLKPISAYACTLQEVTLEYTFYFFGAKTTKELSSSFSPVSLQRCLSWTQTASDDTLGPLSPSQDNVNTFETSVPFKPLYKCNNTACDKRRF